MSFNFRTTPRAPGETPGLSSLRESPPTLSELVELGATDARLFCHGFFPKTFRQGFPQFAPRLWDALDSDAVRYLNAQMFRGSSKTTTVRAFAARRISYGRSRTIVFISAEERQAQRNLSWIKNNILREGPWQKGFGLLKGGRWNEAEIEIIHSALDVRINAIAVGLTSGGIRGINIDDWRPDLIVLDDIITDQVAASPTQLSKVEELVLGAVANSLAPEVDSPGAKMVLLQTPFDTNDVTMKAMRDPSWVTIQQGCWSDATKDLEFEDQRSVWEERIPTIELHEKKKSHIARNKLSLFTREMECKLTSRETSDFDPQWLNYYEGDLDMRGMKVIISIDPVPPPSEREIKLGMRGKDYEAIVVMGYKKSRYYLLDYAYNRGHNPNWTLSTLFGLIGRWRPRVIRVETIAYQRTLAYLIRQEMHRRNKFVFVDEASDRRAKPDRIVDAVLGVASNHALYVRREHTEFIDQLTTYPNCGHDDILDAVATALVGLQSLEIELDADESDDDDDFESDGLPSFSVEYGAP